MGYPSLRLVGYQCIVVRNGWSLCLSGCVTSGVGGCAVSKVEEEVELMDDWADDEVVEGEMVTAHNARSVLPHPSPPPFWRHTTPLPPQLIWLTHTCHDNPSLPLSGSFLRLPTSVLGAGVSQEGPGS